MAVTASGLFYLTIRDALANTIALDLDGTDNKVALFNNSITPNFDTDTAYGTGTYASNEVSGTNWAAGGQTLSTPTFSVTGGTLKWTAANISVASTTLSAFRCALVYGISATSKNAVVLLNFGQDYSTSNGTVQINWNTNGIFTIDLTP